MRSRGILQTDNFEISFTVSNIEDNADVCRVT